ncbi:MAG: T9SS type A sorting domain-containing protein, partial [Fimbriimonadaceae bacterium]|nr:T9SS type A sorting domain-containing protein [Chitinophagales bacterium]
NDADVFISTDGGSSKTNITGTLPDRYPRDFAINKNDPDEVYICYAGFGAGHIFKSVNAGTEWEDISTTLPDIPFHTILMDPLDDSILYAGSDNTLFVSFDKGVTWETYNDGLPEAAMVFDIQYSPSDTSLFVFTHGRGVFNAPALKDEEDTIEIAIENIDNTLSGNIYPNIVADEFTVELNTILKDVVSVQLFDMQGKLIRKNTYPASDENKFTINCLGIADNSYIVKVTQGNNVFSEKIVILE